MLRPVIASRYPFDSSKLWSVYLLIAVLLCLCVFALKNLSAMALPGISRFQNRVALVTGASVGIGEAICDTLVRHGMIVIDCARHTEPIVVSGSI